MPSECRRSGLPGLESTIKGLSARVGSAAWSARTETNTGETWRMRELEAAIQLTLPRYSRLALSRCMRELWPPARIKP
jgi:hypothetical protein